MKKIFVLMMVCVLSAMMFIPAEAFSEPTDSSEGTYCNVEGCDVEGMHFHGSNKVQDVAGEETNETAETDKDIDWTVIVDIIEAVAIIVIIPVLLILLLRKKKRQE